jgi:protein TonB
LLIQPFDVFGTQEPPSPPVVASSPTVASPPVPPSSPLLLPEELPLLEPEELPLVLPPDELPDELPEVEPEVLPEVEPPPPLLPLLPPEEEPDDEPEPLLESAVPHPGRTATTAMASEAASEERMGTCRRKDRPPVMPAGPARSSNNRTGVRHGVTVHDSATIGRLWWNRLTAAGLSAWSDPGPLSRRDVTVFLRQLR